MKGLLWAAVLAASLTAAACSGHPPDPSNATADAPAGRYEPKALPPGPVGQSIAYGHAIVLKTQWLMKDYVRSDMSCADCHIAGGTQPRGGSFVGTYGRFPQWNKRAHRVIALQDRIAECFLYSMNGKPPPYNSKAMIAIVAYIAWLSRGTTVGASQAPADRSRALPTASPDVHHGAQIYSTACETCHGVRRAGTLRFLSAALGAAIVQQPRGHGALGEDDRLRSLQYAGERSGDTHGRRGIRRLRLRAEPQAAALPLGGSSNAAGRAGEVLLSEVVGPRCRRR